MTRARPCKLTLGTAILAVLTLAGAGLVQADITYETALEEYQQGMICQFILRNETEYVLDVPLDDLPGISSVTEDCVVFPCTEFYSGTVWNVQPWSVNPISWDQTYGEMEFCPDPATACDGPSGEQVRPGTYRSRISWEVPDAPELSGSASVTFVIGEDTPAAGATWARIKALFSD